MTFEPGIDTGDTVYHVYVEEYWIVAYVDKDKLSWLGWPEGEVNLNECRLVTKCTPEFRKDTLKNMAASSGRRGDYARNRIKL